MRYIHTFLFCVIFYYAKTQCTLPTPIPNVDCGTGTALADGVNIMTGQTYFFSGTGGNFTNVTISGGILVICGSLTLTNTNLNSGTVLIKPGADITFNGNLNIGSPVNYYNQGTTTANALVQVQGNNLLYNAPGATIQTNNDLVVFNSGLFVNEGDAIANNVLINSGASMCFGAASTAAIVSMTNNASNPITVPTGTACLSYSMSFGGNNPITAASNLLLCQQPGASNPAPAVIGAAMHMSNCSSCPGNIPTPLKLISFKGNELNGQVSLEWSTAFEENVRSFVIERSNDGQHFEISSEVTANNSPSTYHYMTNITTKTFFRLKMVDIDGSFSYSYIIVLDAGVHSPGWKILSNPIINSVAELFVNVSKDQSAELVIADNTGRILKKIQLSLLKGNNFVRVSIADIAAGQYYFHLNQAEERNKVLPVIKIR